MKGYKAFDKGLICRGKQYKENTVFEEEDARICHSGMHFCKNPLAVLDYYPLVDGDGNISEFAEVEALDDCKTDDNEKYCTKKLKIGAKLSFAELVQASVNFEMETPKETKVKTTGKNYAKIGSSGDSAKINSEGEHSVICCAGHNSIVKAKKGSWITLSEWKRCETYGEWKPICVKTEYVDGENIKADTYYKLINGEFVEV